MLAFTYFTPYIAMILMGLAYSILAASLWPIVSYFVPENQLGTAYGLWVWLVNQRIIGEPLKHACVKLVNLNYKSNIAVDQIWVESEKPEPEWTALRYGCNYTGSLQWGCSTSRSSFTRDTWCGVADMELLPLSWTCHNALAQGNSIAWNLGLLQYQCTDIPFYIYMPINVFDMQVAKYIVCVLYMYWICNMYMYCICITCICSMQSIQNAGLAAVSQISGSIVDGNGYLILITFYLVSIYCRNYTSYSSNR